MRIMSGFSQKLQDIQLRKHSMLCVGLDPDPERLPKHLRNAYSLPEAVVAFNRDIIDATAPYACAFKLNFAFFESLGPDGHAVLAETLAHVPGNVCTIADAKRGDIGNSARFYAKAIFESLGFDACTVAPYMGRDAVAPFLAYPDKATFVLARTSNPSGADFQERLCEGEALYERVARHVASWDDTYPGTAGLVVGATNHEALVRLRAVCPSLPFLIPGVGAQGGDPAATAAAYAGHGSMLVNSSRNILYASGERDFAEQAAQQAQAARTLLSRSIGPAPA